MNSNAHNNKENRASEIKRSSSSFSCAQRAVRVKFFRNGDKYFTGFLFPLNINRYKNFETLLKDLSSSNFCDKKIMPFGVRAIFTLSGLRITDVHQMEEGESYVCSSSNLFVPIDYLHETCNPKWKTTKLFVSEVIPVAPLKAKNSKNSQKVRSLASLTMHGTQGSCSNNAQSFQQAKLQKTITCNSTLQTHPKPQTPIHQQQQVIKNGAKLINIVRHSTGRPRHIFQWLLNSKTAPTFGKVLDDLSTLIKLDSGCVKHLLTAEGKEIMTVNQLFEVDGIFFAFGSDFIDKNDLILTSQELSSMDKPKKTTTIKSVDVPKEDILLEQNGLQKLTEKYMIGNEIGVGNFSIVKECRDKKRDVLMALKIIDKTKCDKNQERLMREINIMKKLKHVNIIRLINRFDTAQKIYLVLEYSQGGSMADFLMKMQSYSEQDISGMMHNISSGLQYLHSNKIVHRDIKFENILIHEDSTGLTQLKICDFGLSSEMLDDKLLNVVCGTPHFMAPEILMQNGYGTSVDIWSMGVMLYILLVGVPPFSGPNNDFNEIFERILNGEYEETSADNWVHITAEAKDLLKNLLARDVKLRFNAVDVLNFPWVSEDDVAANVDLWPHTSKGMTKYFQDYKCLDQSSTNNHLARTALDKDSNYFETDENVE